MSTTLTYDIDGLVAWDRYSVTWSQPLQHFFGASSRVYSQTLLCGLLPEQGLQFPVVSLSPSLDYVYEDLRIQAHFCHLPCLIDLIQHHSWVRLLQGQDHHHQLLVSWSSDP